jgi:PAS domain S-box-containing protein
MTDAKGRITFYNEAAAELWGCRPKLGVNEWCGSWKLFWPDGREMTHGECPMAIAVREGRPIRGAEAIAERPDGTRVPFIPFPTPLFDSSGQLVGAVNMLVDITERKRAEQRQALLTRELHHRTKNLFAVVQAIVSRGFEGTRSLEDVRAVVIGRLRALAHTHTKLDASGWQGADLGDVVRTELRPFAGPRVEIRGPALMLGPQAAQNFALVIHELVTNAIKHGALSVPAGKVAIQWSIEGANDDGRFLFRWQERDGPPVKPSTYKGFGNTVLERLMTDELARAPLIDLAPGGLTYELNVTLESVAARSWRQSSDSGAAFEPS